LLKLLSNYPAAPEQIKAFVRIQVKGYPCPVSGNVRSSDPNVLDAIALAQVQLVHIQRTEYSLTVEYDGYIVRYEP